MKICIADLSRLNEELDHSGSQAWAEPSLHGAAVFERMWRESARQMRSCGGN